MDPLTFDSFDPNAPVQPSKAHYSGSRHEHILSQIEASATKPDQVSKTVAHSQPEAKPFNLGTNFGIHNKRTAINTKPKPKQSVLRPRITKRITKQKAAEAKKTVVPSK